MRNAKQPTMHNKTRHQFGAGPSRRQWLASVAALPAAALLASNPAAAQTYPSRVITIVNPYAPGAGVDPVARLVAQKLSERLGQTVIVENRMGAAGMIGAGAVAAAAPDGYTLLISASNDMAINQHLYKNIKYKAERDFVPITQIVQLPMVMVVHPAVRAQTLQEFLVLARAKPGGLTYATPGNGTLQHLVAARLQSLTGIEMLHVPYKDKLLVDLLAGRIDASFLGAHVVAPYVKAGALRALLTTGAERSPVYPSLLTAAEQGLPGLTMTQWFGAYAPAGTPQAIVRRLNQEMVAIVQSPEVRKTLVEQGAEPVGSTPEAFAQFLKSEIAKFGELVRISGATVEQ
jgi:tripartite-type tricarboxylate transporter receptor subunit TctC